VSFFCTTSDLFKRRPLLLGRDFLCNGEFLRRPGSYDFVNATLCSSAFPAVFAPRSESQLIPGSGQTDVLLADGGMFDNLPFLPAIEVLGDVQSQHRRRNRPGQDLEQEGQRALEFLARRQARPDLLIAAALDADAEEKGGRDLGTLWKIQKRVQSLENNVKSKAFATSAERTGKQTQKLLKSTAFARSAKRTGTQTQKLLATPPAKTTVQFVDFVDKTVAAGVLQIIPTDTEHINGTFAFCRSAGMEVKRVQQSIADGCFQTFRSIAQAQRNTEVESKMLHAAIMKSRVPAIGARVPRGGDANCSYFQKDGGPSIPCPFVAAAGEDARICGIRDICAADGRHRELYAELAKGK
jgi:predicted acylesterase/phospholipase RssA